MSAAIRWQHQFGRPSHKMHAIRTFLVLSLAACSLAAPADDEPAECTPPTKEKEIEASKCCKMVGYQEKSREVIKSCMDLVKDKPAKGEKKEGPPPVLIPEGYECMDDCILSKLGSMADKTLDTDKILASAKTFYTDDWATVGPAFVKKCLDQAASAEKKKCPTSGADNFAQCIFRETYMNCPTKSWTDSEVCKANKERLQKCPKAVPFICMHGVKEQ